jgi:hypothetical protein
MNSRLVLCWVVGVLLLAIPSTSQAQGRGYGRSGVVQGPDGPLYDTRSPEWRMSGGNIFVYEQLVEQKMMLQQQKLMMRQQQMQMRQMQQATRKRAGRAAVPAAIRQNGVGANDQQGGALPPRRKRKTPATAGINASAGSTRKKGGPTSNSDSATPKSGAASPAPLEPPNSPD